MLCALCQQREANKKNTHYLTDGIIRSCLNIDDSSERERGLYFDMSSKSHVNFNFQRSTSPEKLEELLNRPVSEEEIHSASQNPYSVDNVFCDNCEKIFTEIENAFTRDILPKFRQSNLASKTSVSIENSRIARLFFYLQVWRSAVCVPKLSISQEVKERLRQFILNHQVVSQEELSTYPLLITYLETLGGQEAFTQNFVGFINAGNPLIIFMNDFVVQFLESLQEPKFALLPDLNKDDFAAYINQNEIEFTVRVLNDSKRTAFLKAYRQNDARIRVGHYAKSFVKLWVEIFGREPQPGIVQEYIHELVKNDEESIFNYTKENIMKITEEFIRKRGYNA